MKDKIVIGINGIKRSGKDTAAGYLRHNLRGDVTTLYWAGLLKKISAMALGLPEKYFFDDKSKSEKFLVGLGPDDYLTGRQILQRVGTECFRDNIHKDFWVRCMVGQIDSAYSKYILIPDTRFPNEYEKIKELGGYVIRVVRRQVETGDMHISERALDGYDFDAIIDNSGSYLAKPFHGSYLAKPFQHGLDDFIKSVKFLEAQKNG